MENTKDLIRAKALAFNNSIRAMQGNGKLELPSARFGEDYNSLRQNARFEFPEIDFLLPPEASIDTDAGITCTRYSEIDTFCEQIYQLLTALPE